MQRAHASLCVAHACACACKEGASKTAAVLLLHTHAPSKPVLAPVLEVCVVTGQAICVGETPFRQLLRAVKAATADAWESGSAPLPALAEVLDVAVEAATFPIFQTVVALYDYDGDRASTALVQLAADALGVRASARPRSLRPLSKMLVA